MCLSTNEEPWTERVVNQICVAVAGYNETINRKKCTCINNFKYREHQNKYTKSSWEEKYDSISDYCTLDPHCAGTSSTFKSIYTRIMWLLFSPFQKEKKRRKTLLFGGRECFVFDNFMEFGTLSLNYKSVTFFQARC